MATHLAEPANRATFMALDRTPDRIFMSPLGWLFDRTCMCRIAPESKVGARRMREALWLLLDSINDGMVGSLDIQVWWSSATFPEAEPQHGLRAEANTGSACPVAATERTPLLWSVLIRFSWPCLLVAAC